jgi:hypothetical protein
MVKKTHGKGGESGEDYRVFEHVHIKLSQAIKSDKPIRHYVFDKDEIYAVIEDTILNYRNFPGADSLSRKLKDMHSKGEISGDDMRRRMAKAEVDYYSDGLESISDSKDVVEEKTLSLWHKHFPGDRKLWSQLMVMYKAGKLSREDVIYRMHRAQCDFYGYNKKPELGFKEKEKLREGVK